MEDSRVDSKGKILFSVILGGSLEFFQIGLLIYWQLMIEGSIPAFDILETESVNSLTIFLLIVIYPITNALMRAIGGYFFSRIGDKKSRLKAFTNSIFFSSAITLVFFLLSFFLSRKIWINYYSWILIGCKILQNIPSGAEVAGSICFLCETSSPNLRKKNHWTSKVVMACFSLLGPQVGLLLSAIVCFTLKSIFPTELLQDHGWRYLFSFSAALGTAGVIIRKKLHESYAFKTKHHLLHQPAKTLCSKYNYRWRIGALISIFEVVCFSILSILPFYFNKSPFFIGAKQVTVLSFVFSVTSIITIILIGCFYQKIKHFPVLKISVFGSVFLSPLLYFSLKQGLFSLSMIISFFMLFFMNVYAAILPYLLGEIFPIKLRFTGISFSFTVLDALFWSALTGICVLSIKNNTPLFVLIIPFSSIAFLLAKKQSKNVKKLYKQIR